MAKCKSQPTSMVLEIINTARFTPGRRDRRAVNPLTLSDCSRLQQVGLTPIHSLTVLARFVLLCYASFLNQVVISLL